MKIKQYIELSDKQIVVFDHFKIQAFKVPHPSSRWRYGRSKETLGYFLIFPHFSICFVGDTAFYPEIAEFYGSIKKLKYIILPIGAYHPFIHRHCSPEQALEMACALGGEYIIPSHFGTFQLSAESRGEPLERLKIAVELEQRPIRILDLLE